MVKNYIKIALRNIQKYAGYSFINILGLSIGMALCILILLFVRYELSYDKYHEHSERIYRLERRYIDSDGSIAGGFATLAPSFTPFLEKDFPQIEHISRIWNPGNTLISYGDKKFIEDGFYFAEFDIFEVFTLPLIRGDSQTALAEPNSIVISESMAEKYFSDEDPVGRQVKVDRTRLFQVTGVMKDMPSNSHAHFDFLASYITLKGLYGTNENDYFWGIRNFSDNVTHTYMRLAPNTDLEEIESAVPAFLDKYMGTRKDRDGKIIRASQGTTIIFQKVTDIHLHSNTRDELEPNSDYRYVLLFTIIAVFVLIIACINFMNLSTARAAKRAKEVGLRKVIGADRQLLMFQFMGESLMMALIAMILAFILVGLSLSYFSSFSGRNLGFKLLLDPVGIVLILGVFVLTGFASGFYPAVYLSSYNPASILRGEVTRGKRGALMRQVLVVFQFAISIALIVCVGVVFRQMRFLQNVDLGFERENIVLIPADGVVREKWSQFKQSLVTTPHILHATLSKRTPTGRLMDAPGFRTEVYGEAKVSSIYMPHNRIEHDFFKTYGMKIIAGRDFSIEYSTDASEAFIINELAVHQLGWKSIEDAIGAPMSVLGRKQGHVIGVVANFNYESLHNEIVPIVSYILPQQANTVSLRIAGGKTQEALNYAEEVWTRLHPESAFSYDFLNDRIAELYRNETRMMQMFGYFSLFAIFIASLGLFGLASFTAEQRTKEIGIRKVMGATLSHILFLLSKEFTKWVLAANVIAWPVAFFAMRGWLINFAYRIRIGWLEFILAAVLTFLIALLTVSYQSTKAGLANPADCIRYE